MQTDRQRIAKTINMIVTGEGRMNFGGRAGETADKSGTSPLLCHEQRSAKTNGKVTGSCPCDGARDAWRVECATGVDNFHRQAHAVGA